MSSRKPFNPPLKFWYITAFSSGFVILSLEMIGFRFLAPWFGHSTYVWGGLLGVIMATLSVGYYFGGALADKKPEGVIALDIILLASSYLILTAVFYKTLLEIMGGWGIIVGSIMSSIVLFGPPMTLLGMISPFLIRLLAHEETVGSIAGKIFAVSTCGSLLGTFLTSFVLIPEYGSFKTLSGLIITLSALYLTGNLGLSWRMAIGIGIAIIAPLIPTEKAKGNIVYEAESAYNLIKIRKEENLYTLVLNGGPWMHSSYRKGMVSTGFYYDYMLLGPLLTKSRDLLILGGGAGTSMRQFLMNFPEIHVDSVEIDPKIIAVGKRYFGWPQSPNLSVYAEDARPFLSRTLKLYDLIEVDVFAGGPFIPFYLTTQEFFSEIRNKLHPGGWLMMNVITKKQNRALSDSLGNTIRSVFPRLFVIDLEVNLILFAPAKDVSLEKVKNLLRNIPSSPLKVLANHATKKIQEFHFNENALIFTDDKAPTEKLIYEMVKDDYR